MHQISFVDNNLKGKDSLSKNALRLFADEQNRMDNREEKLKLNLAKVDQIYCFVAHTSRDLLMISFCKELGALKNLVINTDTAFIVGCKEF